MFSKECNILGAWTFDVCDDVLDWRAERNFSCVVYCMSHIWKKNSHLYFLLTFSVIVYFNFSVKIEYYSYVDI